MRFMSSDVSGEGLKPSQTTFVFHICRGKFCENAHCLPYSFVFTEEPSLTTLPSSRVSRS
ncbi:hypothetical protein V22_33210 [Calycomorphotria hydatis]|uniref:Uncharacterized protein n=1 Tax=Calycomorphotria hydatis TaxID=2528027 RepID=A0A517TCF8_9PLAN|nr:hypothetical protein V22_33210 [Calycomorphotria hydatis]